MYPIISPFQNRPKGARRASVGLPRSLDDAPPRAGGSLCAEHLCNKVWELIVIPGYLADGRGVRPRLKPLTEISFDL